MVRVRGRNSNIRPSIPIRNPGVQRRSIFRELHTRGNHPQNNTEVTLEFIQSENNTATLFEIPPSSLIVPTILPDYEESGAEEEYVEIIHDDHNDGFFLEINIEQPSVQIPREAFLAWEQKAEIIQTPSTQDKQTQCPEIPLSPNYSPVYSREYSPVLSPYPRWYLLPEEDPEQAFHNPFYNINQENL